MKKSFNKFLDVMQEIEKSRGYQIDNKAYELENSLIVTVMNFGELKKILENVPVFNVEQKRNGESRRFQVNALRIFANYLANAIAFRDHIRNFIKNIYGSTKEAFDGKYQEKVNSGFKGDTFVQFVEDIRNFHQHYKPLPIGITTRVHDDAFYSRVVLFRDSLLESGYTWGKGKQFLEKIGNEIDVLQVAEDYLYKTIFPWIMQQQAKYHKEEFDELEIFKAVAEKLYYYGKDKITT